MQKKSNSDARQRRLAEVERVLRWEGRLNRSRVMELYGLSPIRASELIREFREQNDGATEWDSRSRSFNATSAAYAGAAAGEGLDWYLDRVGLRRAAPGASGGALWSASDDFSRPDARVFATILRAAEDRHRVELMYRSFGEPKPHARQVEPHSLIQAGRRWHVRALSLEHGEFRDFNLGRIVKVRKLDEASMSSADDDEAWNAYVKVILVAHPELTHDQADVVRFEFFRGTARRIETCRGALAQYLIQDLRAAVDTHKQLPPDYQLAVDNIEEVRPWLFPA